MTPSTPKTELPSTTQNHMETKQLEDRLQKLEDRVQKLDAQLAFLRGTAAVTAACIIAFLGYTVIDIPRKVRAQVTEKIGADVVERVKAFNHEYKQLSANADTARGKLFGPYEIVPIHRSNYDLPNVNVSAFLYSTEKDEGDKRWNYQKIAFYGLRMK